MTKKRTQNITISAGIALAAAVVVFIHAYCERSRGPDVQVETIERRDLEAVVSTSGRIEPERLVNISADTMGR